LRPAFVVTRLITPSLRRSEGRCDQLGVAVRAAPQAQPLRQP